LIAATGENPMAAFFWALVESWLQKRLRKKSFPSKNRDLSG
jgi:hypothetical protein